MLKQKSEFSKTPLFEYLDEKRSEEFASKVAKNKVSNLRIFYLSNLLLSLFVIFSICSMFYVQFKVDSLRSGLAIAQSHVDDHNSELRLLSIEWAYLTRPDRLRSLSRIYLSNDGIVAFNQVKSYDELQKFYTANLKKHEGTMKVSSVSSF
jgi:hypothetical protein